MSKKDSPIKLIAEREFNLGEALNKRMGCDTGFEIVLSENGMSGLRVEFNNLKGKEVEIENKLYLVIGIEAFATGPDYDHRSIGLAVKEIKHE